MTISAMKQALEALVSSTGELRLRLASPTDAQLIKNERTIAALRQAIAEAEKQEPVAWEGWVLREVYFSEGEPIGHREPQWVGLRDEELPEGETYDFDRGVRWAEQYLKQKIVPSDYSNSHQQEPFAVAWVLDGELFWPSEYEVIAQAGDKAIPLYTAPVHASDISQEPVDETAKRGHELAGTIPISNGGIATRTPSSFISPPKREWVGLTVQESEELWDKAVDHQEHFCSQYADFADAIEAKLKEKNT